SAIRLMSGSSPTPPKLRQSAQRRLAHPRTQTTRRWADAVAKSLTSFFLEFGEGAIRRHQSRQHRRDQLRWLDGTLTDLPGGHLAVRDDALGAIFLHDARRSNCESLRIGYSHCRLLLQRSRLFTI